MALVDLALRRRFSFVTLEPRFGAEWKDWLTARIEPAHGRERVDALAMGVALLNQRISQDPTLGANFAIGHSFFTPTDPLPDSIAWFREQVEGSVRPLLHEYWFDDRPKADQLADELLGVWT